MNRIEKQQQMARLETLTKLALGSDRAFCGHVYSRQQSAGTPVVVRVAHVGSSLVVKVYATAKKIDRSNVVSLPTRVLTKIVNAIDEAVHWFAIDDQQQLYPIDPPTLTELPLRSQELMTCFHPLTPSDLAEDEVESYDIAIEA